MAAPSRYSGADLFIGHLAKPLHEPEGDEGAPQTEEGLVDVGSTLVAHRQSAESMQPRECPLHHPSVATESVLRFNAASCDPRDDAPVAAGSATTREVVALIGMELRRPVTRRTAPAAHRPNAVEQLLEPLGVVFVRRAELYREGEAPRVYQHMVLRARFTSIRRVRPGLVAPFFAGTLEASRAARDQSIADAACSSSAGPGAAFATPRLRSSLAAGASTSCRCRSPSPGEASPRGCRS